MLKTKTMIQQVQAIKSRWPGFVVSLSGGQLAAVGRLRPTARSDKYSVKLTYRLEKRPEVTVLEPVITANFNGEMPEHLYPGNVLCLYRPIYGEFKFSDLISETIIPWASLWLYHYEVWHMTGDWLGGGEHPG